VSFLSLLLKIRSSDVRHLAVRGSKGQSPSVTLTTTWSFLDYVKATTVPKSAAKIMGMVELL
jgi:hypothetical protein